jgi:L-rhamnose mutarotase
MSSPQQLSGSVRRVGSMIHLAPGAEEQYRRLHRAVPPGVLARLTASGISNYSIYLHADVLFGYFEYVGDDYERDMALIAADPETQAWWEVMAPLQRRSDAADPAEWWATMDEVFHLDSRQAGC